MFKIKSIKAVTENSEVSSIDFEDGLNIICGPSNTGKSLILECIDFAFGREDAIDPSLKIKEVCMNLTTDGGEVTITRNATKGKTPVTVISTDPEIPSGTFTQNGKVTTSSVFLRLLGITEKAKIISTKKWKTVNLSFRNLINTFMLQEDDIRNKKSALLPNELVQYTQAKSGLLYLLTGETYVGELKETEEEKKNRKKVLAKYFEDQIATLQKEIEAMEKEIDGDENIDDTPIDSLNKETELVSKEINSLLQTVNELNNKLLSLDNQIAEDSNLLEKYEILLSQYQSDIRRMQLIIDGEANMGESQEKVVCPFCNNEMNLEHNESCSDAAEAEIQKILLKIKDLSKAKDELTAELDKLSKDKEEFASQKDKDSKRMEELKPALNDLNNEIKEYRNKVLKITKLNEKRDLLQSYIAKQGANEQEKTSVEDFDQNKLFDGDFVNQLSTRLAEILKTSKFENFNNASFDINQFDAVVNNKAKRYEGEGFRGFINSCLTLAFNEYLLEKGLFKSGVLVLDSPVLSLKEVDGKPVGETMAAGLFSRFVKKAAGLQLIIIENTIPEIDYKNANVIKFTRDPEQGRYGFIRNYKD